MWVGGTVHQGLSQKKDIVALLDRETITYTLLSTVIVWPYSLCALYSTTLRHCTHHSLSHHCFSGDNQLYKSGHISQLQDIIQSTQCCISDLKDWMTNIKLQLDEDRGISVSSKIRLMESLVTSIFLYACESWTLQQSSKEE